MVEYFMFHRSSGFFSYARTQAQHRIRRRAPCPTVGRKNHTAAPGIVYGQSTGLETENKRWEGSGGKARDAYAV